jgi:hypothetical protein
VYHAHDSHACSSQVVPSTSFQGLTKRLINVPEIAFRTVDVTRFMTLQLSLELTADDDSLLG